ncbi:MAG: hypothetical protein AAFV25_25955, partial [Bacteroidota bacterium]
QAQQDVNTSFKDLSIEIQAYPTGVLYGLRFDTGLGAKSSGNVRLGYNMVRHRDLGVNEDERGGGFGGSLGYRYHLSPSKEKWFGGMRTDVWFNEVEWKNQIGEIDEDKGTTNIVVLQPTVEAGYVLPLGEGGWFLSPSIAFGFEINVVSDGKDVGQGAILLVGFSFGKRFR